LALEETVGGRPMIDQPGYCWVIPTIVVALAFVGRGAMATRNLSPSFRALMQGSS